MAEIKKTANKVRGKLKCPSVCLLFFQLFCFILLRFPGPIFRKFTYFKACLFKIDHGNNRLGLTIKMNPFFNDLNEQFSLKNTWKPLKTKGNKTFSTQ